MTEPPALPALVRYGMGWAWEPGLGIRLRVDRLANRSDETTAEIEVLSGGKHVHLARLNLCSTTSRSGLVKLLAARTNGAGVPWDTFIEQLCVGVLQKERAGEPTQYTSDLPLPPTRYLVDRLVQAHKPNLLFGPGGGGKGYLAVAMSVAVATGHGIGPLSVMKATPFYADWEDDFETFNARVKRVSTGLRIGVPRIAYRRMKGQLADRVNELARAIAAEGATFGVIDSVSACSGSPGRSESWDYIAHRLFDALDLIPSGVAGQPMTWLLIGHVTGEDARRRAQATGKMFGSIQNMNRARCAWEVRSAQSPGASTVLTTLYHAKWNHTGAQLPINLSLTFDADAIRIDEAAPEARSPRVAMTLADRIEEALEQRAPQSIRALVLQCREDEAKVRTTLNRGLKAGRFARAGEGMWCLPDDATPTEDVPW